MWGRDAAAGHSCGLAMAVETERPLPACRAPKGCPCTPQLLCSTDERGIFNQFCDIPRAPVSTFSMHGGAGGIMSVGLLRAVSFDFMEMCVKSLYSTGAHLACPCIGGAPPTLMALVRGHDMAAHVRPQQLDPTPA